MTAMKTVFVTLLFFSTGYCAVDFSERARNFSIELLHNTQLETDGHVVISPFGVWSLMTGVSLGATGNSQAQLTRAFVLPKRTKQIVKGYRNLTAMVLDPTTKGVTMMSKNFMFLDNGFNIMSDFRDTMTRDFGAEIENLDFKDSGAAARIANNIIQNTGATVTNVLRSLDFDNSRMILTNVITFKGSWSLPFNTSDTTEEPFYDENKKELGKVNMMFQQSEFLYSNIREIKSLILELPYGDDNKYCMLVMLPYPKVKPSEVYFKLQTMSFPDIFKRLKSDEDYYGLSEISVKLPRFKISTNVVLNKPLNNMGVYDIFEPTRASFKQVTNEDIFVSAIVHKADIEVTETGTVASAATSAFFADRTTIPTFHANRAFIYFVMEKPTATVLFSGIYSKPTVF